MKHIIKQIVIATKKTWGSFEASGALGKLPFGNPALINPINRKSQVWCHSSQELTDKASLSRIVSLHPLGEMLTSVGVRGKCKAKNYSV